MRPVIRNTKPSYVPPTEVQIKTESILAYLDKKGISPKPKTKTIFYTSDIIPTMAILSEKNAGAVSWTGLDDDDKTLMAKLVDDVFDSYPDARRSLINNFGQYCAYCGMFVGDSSLAVEHMLPKSVFADQMMCYPNFLLACSGCNSNKGAKPTYSEANKWAVTLYNTQKPTYAQIQNGGYFSAVWPDNRDLPPSLSEINTAAYTVFDLKIVNEKSQLISDGFNIRNIWVSIDYNYNMVKARISGEQTSRLVGTWFNLVGKPGSVQRASYTIDMLKLNDFGSFENRMTDRRMLNRTIVFFEILAAFRRLNNFAITDKTEEKTFYNALADQVLSTALSSGFHEIWTYVLYYHCSKSESNDIKSFYTNFKQKTCSNKSPYFYFAGTDANRLPK